MLKVAAKRPARLSTFNYLNASGYENWDQRHYVEQSADLPSQCRKLEDHPLRKVPGAARYSWWAAKAVGSGMTLTFEARVGMGAASK